MALLSDVEPMNLECRDRLSKSATMFLIWNKRSAYMKRSNIKLITLKSRTLRYMRIIRGIPQREAARRMGLAESTVGHYEQGRMAISEDRLNGFLEIYGFTREEFDAFISGKTAIPAVSMRDECFTLVNRLDESKLKAVHAMLTSFLY